MQAGGTSRPRTHVHQPEGGAAKVDKLIGLAPSNHGTTSNGLNGTLVLLQEPALPEQEVGSAFETNLFRDGDTVAGPRYWVVETSHDEVVAPFTQAFLSGATNILIQNQCPNDRRRCRTCRTPSRAEARRSSRPARASARL